MQVAGTVTYPLQFNADADADAIFKACKGAGTREAEINAIVGHRSLSQRNSIREAFYQKYQKDVVEVLKSETTGDYDSLLQTLFRGHLDILAYDLYKGMKVMRERSSNKNDNHTLEGDIAKETKPPYEALLLRILKGKRQEDNAERVEQAQRSGNLSSLVNDKQVEADVRILHQAGEGSGKKGNPDPFIEILCDRSKYHIKAVWEVYKQRHNRTLVETITDKFSEPIRGAFNTLVMAQVNLRLLLVCQLYESMYGAGTDEDTLIRIICLRCENDMTAIKHMYFDFFGKKLVDAVKSDTSGDFRKLLLILIGEQQ